MASEYFKYSFSVTKVSAGVYTIVGPGGAGGAHYTITETADNGSDNLTQLGDIGNDHFSDTASGTVSGTYTGVYVGDTSNGLSFVGEFNVNHFYLYTNNSSYLSGSNISITNTPFTIACYLAGTLIRTVAGDVSVESLVIGDEVLTAAGEVRPIKWIGRRSYAGRFIAGNRAVLPIRVSAGALADGVPMRDLSISPEHALYIDGYLVPAQHLVNGTTITQTEMVEEVEYFHIELDTHDVIFAEGAAAESYVDCDNRMMFANASEHAALYPDDDRPRWQFAAPRLERGAPEMTKIRAALFQRAAAAGHTLDYDPDLHLVVDGAAIRPESVTGRTYRFTVPAGSKTVCLASSTVVAAEIDAASVDIRRLGVPVEGCALQDGDMTIKAGHGHPLLRDGFYDDEVSHRWTNGMARLPETWLRAFAGGFTLEVQLVSSGLGYPRPTALQQAA
ncbi:MAG TPA: Hint domain-containing protein [Stellaceae bacterium]|jgi:hypothetical protein|nr:Hint domain-containing protein [Stellaceae bacterium]